MSAEKVANRRHYKLLLVVAQLREDGESQHLSGGAFALRKIAFAVAQGSQRFLLMEREGIVDLRSDTLLGEPCPQLVPACDANDVLVVDVMGARVGPR